MKKIDIAAILGYIVGLGALVLAPVFPQQIDAMLGVFGVAPGWGAKVVTLIGGAAFMASLLARLLNNKTDAPSTSMTQTAPIVADNTVALHSDTPIVAVNTHSPVS